MSSDAGLIKQVAKVDIIVAMESMKKGYYGRGGPKLDRRNAHKSINYDSSGSLNRRRASDGDDSDASTHSVEEWPMGEFSVHGKESVEEMSTMFRYAGLPAPAYMGIPTDIFESAKQTPTTSPGSGPENSPTAFSFVQDSGAYSLRPKTPSKCPSFPVSSPSGAAAGQNRNLSSPRQFRVSQPGNSGAGLRNTSPSSEAATNPNLSRNNAGSERPKGKVQFANLVYQVQAQAQNDAAAAADVSKFIDRHRGEEDLIRSESLPCRLEVTKDSPLPFGRSGQATAVSATHAVGRTHSDPMPGVSLTHGETALLQQENVPAEGFKVLVVDDHEGIAGQQDSTNQFREAPNTAGHQQGPAERVPVISFAPKKKDGETQLTRPPGKGLDGNKSLPIILKPPPNMRINTLSLGQMSTADLFGSLAPDANEILNFRPSSDEEQESDSEGTTSEQVSPRVSNIVLPVSDSEPQQSKPVSNREITGDKVTLEKNDDVVTAEVGDAEPIDVRSVGQNPESELPKGDQTPSDQLVIQSPWTKGSMLGAGSFGTVYEAVDSVGIWFAVKEVSMVEQDKQAQQCISQLMQEIELLSHFKHHNIVQYLGTEKAQGKLYIFLELVSKGSLASICKSIKLSNSQISAYTREILKGLKFLHDQRIVHRDIKCANILVDTKGVCKLADFGMAKRISSLDQTKSCKGSAYWMAPEVIDPKKTYGPPADIWSLGCSILEMATGNPPFGEMEWYRVLWTVGHGTAPPIPDTLSEAAKDFVKHCLEVNPARRPTATELLEHEFVRQSGLLPTLSNFISFGEGASSNLQTITEERSTDLSIGQSTQGNESLPNGVASPTSS